MTKIALLIQYVRAQRALYIISTTTILGLLAACPVGSMESYSLSTRIEPGLHSGYVNLICQGSSSGECIFQITSATKSANDTITETSTVETLKLITVKQGQKSALNIPDSAKITTSYCVAVSISSLKGCNPAVINRGGTETRTSTTSTRQ
jgi:hypothetical protein